MTTERVTTLPTEVTQVVVPVIPAVAPTAPGGDFDPTAWLQGLDARQRTAIDEYADFKAGPLKTELHGLRTEKGRLQKAADPVHVARLSNEERMVEQMKSAAVSLYGVDAKDLEDIETIDALSTALRFITRVPKPASKSDPAQGADAATQEAWKQFLAQRQASPQGLRPPLAPTGGGGIAAETVTPDNADALWLAGRLSDEKYRAFLNRR